MKEKSVLIDLHYLPTLEYFTCILKFDKVIIEAGENYQKQTFRNRCYILGANKVEILTVPIQKPRNNLNIKEVKINNTQRWRQEHWRSIASAYGKAPYFEYFDRLFENIYLKDHVTLFQLNWELLTICLELIGLKFELSISENYLTNPEKGIFDARGMIQPHKKFEFNSFYKPVPYYQVFGSKFAPNLSIIDLLFCEGKNSISILNRSTKSN